MCSILVISLIALNGKKRTFLEVFFLMLDRDAHHCGQVTTYLGLLGVERRGEKDWRGLAHGQ